MFNKFAIKRYVKKLRPLLEKEYGQRSTYSASQIRTTVFKKNFNAKYLPLAYIMCLKKEETQLVLSVEFPDLCVSAFKETINNLVDSAEITQCFNTLSS
ncbi:DUF6559 family protein [Paraglaciecola arctica]|uniref:DUF6559 family protein n=1 Tax=Paraglaciecola arctica TaxID=1128911 RepID=UPI000586895A|nr:DUF6559 family protein [Paraglaciecola arctica]|tara:strand:+ start:484 stop:780 length:297 start_codon:yes stop_codon:yes gene_type:complete